MIIEYQFKVLSEMIKINMENQFKNFLNFWTHQYFTSL